MANKILIGLLQSIVRAIVGALNYERISLLVEDADKSGLDGDTKKAMVLEEARSVILAIGLLMVNLALETAVIALRSRQ